MKIVVVGATGTIGKAIVAKLEQEHTVITASRKGADVADV